ncbi:MAG: bi-domain-containing oxidoreductase [Bacteroidetes bacterium]|nr:bi-domain-containing oxidoreductase [Bacteroidota bacterium]
MEQLTQNLKDGEMKILEVPFPALPGGCILVRNHYSLISAGTEGKTVKDARLGYIGKARARRDEVKKVIDTAKTLGILNTYRMVMNKLDAPSPLGYSCAGEVIAVASDVSDFSIGDRVACGGNGAIHAEVVAVPVNLCVKLDPSVPMEHAAFTTLGAIALQGIRQADLRLGENCVVIGLGLLGQLTIQMLQAAGVRTMGIDIDSRMVKLATDNGCDLAIERGRADLEQQILHFTNGQGTDAVIIVAGTDSTDPVDLAGSLCRKKGKVIVVGAVPTGFKRPNYFKKELDLRMSCSYGPGRYDPEYEEQGLDYPYAYVRWTENRNMQAFVELLRTGKLNLKSLLTHTYNFQDATKAYQLILEKQQPFIGIVLKYDSDKELKTSVHLREHKADPASPAIGLIGAGGFGQNFLLPAMKGKGQFVSVATARPHNARNIADKYGFASCTGNADEVVSNPAINTVFIATRHDSHAEYVLKALSQKKNVFVEKPLCLREEELEGIRKAYADSGSLLMVGFNRRFAPFVTKIREQFREGVPVAINYRINAGIVPADHWIHDPAIGGGRIIGEVCHFIDLCMFIARSPITTLSARWMEDAAGLHDTVTIGLSFANGSTANISYFSNGNKLVSKEYLEVFGSGMVAILDDFKTLSLAGKSMSKSSGNQDKGHQAEVAAFLAAVQNGKESPISADDLFMSTLATFKVLESAAQNGKEITIQL